MVLKKQVNKELHILQGQKSNKKSSKDALLFI